jgi:purine-cytosine permease-like protein
MDTGHPADALPGLAVRGIDEVGQIETHGIDYIPAADRHSHPRNLAWAMFGPQFGFGNMVFGSLPIAFGLSWWSSVAAITIGCLVGSVIFAGVCIQAHRTGTNNAVSSGAFFGIGGRYLGSAISLFIGLGFFAILVWTSGQTIISVFHRIFGSGTGDVALSLAMAVVSLISFALAIYGHATLVACFRFIAISSFVVSIIGVIALSGSFHAVKGGSYLLGSFWATWFVGLLLAASLPISWGPFIGDYGRYIPERESEWATAGMGFLGIFGGCFIAELIGAYATAAFKNPATPFALGFPDAAPLWVAILLMLTAGGLANIESAAMSVYNAALDVHALFWRLSRAQLTFVMSAIGLVVAYVTLVAYNEITSIEAFVTIMLVTCTPWMVIMAIGHLMRRGRYYTLDLQAFAIPGKKGVYWFWNGINLRAFVAWGAATAFGLLFSDTGSLFTGPLATHVSNVDISFMVSAGVGGILYYALVKAFPERGVVPGEAVTVEVPAGPALGMAE